MLSKSSHQLMATWPRSDPGWRPDLRPTKLDLSVPAELLEQVMRPWGPLGSLQRCGRKLTLMVFNSGRIGFIVDFMVFHSGRMGFFMLIIRSIMVFHSGRMDFILISWKLMFKLPLLIDDWFGHYTTLHILRIRIIQERRIPIHKPGFNGMTDGFWTLLS